MKRITVLIVIAILTTALPAAEPVIPGLVVGAISSAQNHTIQLNYTVPGRLYRGNRIAVEWPDGSFYATVLTSRRSSATLSYFPVSVEVPSGATVKLISKK